MTTNTNTDDRFLGVPHLGKDIGVAGGASFAQSLSRDCLIDEYRLTVHPVVLGKGLPLFVEPLKLKLVSTRSFASGFMFLVYQLA